MSVPPPSPRLILASASPRRRELLERAAVPFDAIAPEIDERPRPGESPETTAERLAREKALAVASGQPPEPRRLVLAADTLVVLHGDMLGKPTGPEHAVSLLRRLCGRIHTVLTGVALADTSPRLLEVRVVASRVHLRAASEDELRRYVATGEPLDKAGAYAAQGLGRRFVASIEGSETNVIGLPLEETIPLLRAAGFPLEHAA